MIITIDAKHHYLESIARLIESKNQTGLKIILPTTSACIRLQNILIQNSPNKACILPNIVPIINIGIGSEDIYNIPTNFIEPISSLHQRILLANIIQNEDSDITISGALDLSFHIMRLFDELTDFNIEIDALEDQTFSNKLYDIADHWRYRTEFLKKIYQEWQQALAYYGRIDLSLYRKNILNLEIEAAKNNTYPQILAGIFPKGYFMEELANILAASRDSYFIPPAIDMSKLEEYKDATSKTHYYYQVGKLLKHNRDPEEPAGLRRDPVNLTSEMPCISAPGSLRRFAPLDDDYDNYSIAENLRMESELILSKISSWLQEDSKAQIAIISKNDELINICVNLLENNMISNINLSGYSLTKTKPFEFLILLIESHDQKHGINIEKLIILLKTHYLFSEEAREFEMNIRKNGILAPLHIMEEIKQITPSLKSYISLAEKLAPKLWQSMEGKALSDFLYEILQLEHIEEYMKDNYVDFIKSVARSARYHKNIQSQQVIFMGLEDASIGGYDYIIMTDMNEGSIPSKISSDPWMNNRIRENLGLMDMSEKIGIEWYHFKNLLYRSKIYITRSEKKGGTQTQESRFLQELVSSGGINATL